MPDKMNLPPEVEKYYEKWKKEPQSRVFAQLADAYRKSGMLDEAIDACREGLKIHPSYGSARMVLARTYQDKGMDAEAELELWEIIGSDPNNILANRMLGDLLRKGEKTLEAFEQYKRLLKLTPLDREIKAILEDMEVQLESSPAPLLVKEKEKSLGGGESIEPSPLGAEGREGDSPQEAPDGTKVGESKAEDAFLTETLADLYLKQGLREQAAEIFSRMLASDPNNPHLQERLREAEESPGTRGEESSVPLPNIKDAQEEGSSATIEEEQGEKEVILSAWDGKLSPPSTPEEGQFTQTEGIQDLQSERHTPPSASDRQRILQQWLRATQQRRQRRVG